MSFIETISELNFAFPLTQPSQLPSLSPPRSPRPARSCSPWKHGEVGELAGFERAAFAVVVSKPGAADRVHAKRVFGPASFLIAAVVPSAAIFPSGTASACLTENFESTVRILPLTRIVSAGCA